MKKIDPKEFQKALLNWYELNKKPLPWRETTEPYRIWLSEIMAQQTQVETVIPYYERFLKKYPTLIDLATADDAELLKLWEGLGYYSRARNLKAGAQQIMAEFAGVFPTKLGDIRSIKGIGPYSAASIGSICFGLAEPAIDGNLFRVTSRLFELEADISRASSRKIFDEKIRELISTESPGDFNQALMDIGATICKPKSPRCEACPVQIYCAAYQHGSQENYPVKSKKLKQIPVYYQAFVLRNSLNQYLMAQRPAEGLLASMWTFPMRQVESEKAEVQVPTELRDQIVKFTEIGQITHVFSHQKWYIRLFDCQLAVQGLQEESGLYNQKWLSKKDLAQHALAGPQIKMFKLL